MSKSTISTFELFQMFRLKGEPGSAEFLASYAAAESTKVVRLKDTLGSLVDAFQESCDWDGLASSTKAEYTRIFKIICHQYGTVPIPALEDRAFRADVLEWRDRHGKNAPREADYRVTALARVLAWAADRGILQVNVLSDVRRMYKSDRRDKIWLPEHIEAFMTVAPVELQRALLLALHTGQRQGDLVRLTWASYDGPALMALADFVLSAPVIPKNECRRKSRKQKLEHQSYSARRNSTIRYSVR